MFYTYVGYKNSTLYDIGYDENGKKYIDRISYKPSIYYLSPDGKDKSLYNEVLKKKSFDNMDEFFQFKQYNKDILDLYGDMLPVSQYIQEKYSKREVPFKREFIRIWYIDIEVKTNGSFPFPEEARFPISAISIFDSRYDKFIVLGLKDYTYDKNRINFSDKEVIYKKCDSENDLLDKFIKLNSKFKPDIWNAHNGENFDYPYIINRLKNLGIDPSALSYCGGKVTSRFKEVNANGMATKVYKNDIAGISLLDNMLLYKKYVLEPRESYSLSNLSIEDLGMDKINYEEYDNLENLYEENFTKFIDYNINDVYLMLLLNKKNGYIDLHVRNTYVSKCSNFQIPMSPVALWDNYIYNKLADRNIVIPPANKNNESFKYTGAYVVPTINKKHKWIISLDVNSMYPHIQMEWNISPEKLVKNLTVESWLQSLTIEQIDELISKSDNPKQIEFLNELKTINEMGLKVTPINKDDLDERILNMAIPAHPDYIMTANGFYFQKGDLGIIPELLQFNYNERKSVKSKLKKIEKQLKADINNKELQNEASSLDVEQHGIKIMMNAEYGALANQYFRYCKYELCSSVTMNGQLIDKMLIKELEEQYPLIEVIAGDTDSIFLSYEKLVEQNCKDFTKEQIIDWIDEFTNTNIQKLLDETFEKIRSSVGAPKNYIKMSREKIIESAIWTAKKHYAYKLVDNEGVRLDKPKYGYKGIECIKSSTPSKIRALMKETLNALLDGRDISDIIPECESKIRKMSPEDIAFPRTCNGTTKYKFNPITGFDKGTPIQVKAALTYNHYIKENKIKDYPLINEGTKIRFLYLKEPNIFNSNVFGFINRLPKDEMIIKYVDYDTMIEKAYTKVILDTLKKAEIEMIITDNQMLDDLF